MKKILIFCAIAAAIAGFVGYKMWNKPQQDIAKAKTDVSIDAAALFVEFDANEDAANAKYLDKIVAVTGIIKNIETAESTVIYLEAGAADNEISAEMQPDVKTVLKTGDKVSLKGTLAGKNMFTLEIKRCIVL
jgi:tRNA_anti-like